MSLIIDSPPPLDWPPDSWAGWWGRYRQRRRARLFTARVVAALSELKLERRDLSVQARRLLRETCVFCHDQDPTHAQPHPLAIEFFLRLTLEYPKLLGRHPRQPGLLTHAIGVIRGWQVLGRVEPGLAETSIDRIKRALVERLRELDDAEEERLDAELRIRQL
jgi:hypothetical protein